ncbi:hypothetical protein BKH32_00255 [Actinomyces oris]|uniref:DUF86 domain-containing protein n=2 Tax=Actinomyces oris TaxID=544580 RepID=A0A1Q8I4H8_9ACTO|nr:hypothetical protein BKH32_00255 [Actinomyces oris]
MWRLESLYLREMRDAISRIVTLIDGVPVASDLEDDRVKADAPSWNFTILGEAAAKLPEEFRVGHPEIIWRRSIGLRNRVVHGYWSIDVDILVTTARNDLPELGRQLGALLSGMEP